MITQLLKDATPIQQKERSVPINTSTGTSREGFRQKDRWEANQ